MSEKEKPIRLALMGTRGIPAAYGGFETFAEEISRLLVQKNYHVTVYSRHAPGGKKQRGTVGDVQVYSTLTLMHKYLETPLAALSGFLTLFFKRYDVVFVCNAANSPFSFIPRLLLMPVVTNVDGIERERKKWNALGRLWYRLGEQTAVWFSNRVVADAKVIQDYYREAYSSDSEVIAYGATVKKLPAGDVLSEFELKPQEYVLYVSRLEPENNALGVIEAYVEADIDIPLVIVGDAPYANEYKARLKKAANDRVVFTGFQFGDAYKELRTNCYMYVQATEVGGTHPALVEGMAYGNCVIANGTPENKEVLGDSGLFYNKNNFTELAEILKRLASNAEEVKNWGEKASERAAAEYSWAAVSEKYDTLFRGLIKSRS
jgi:glycosyltransferase involved in cell wall biosynthesis